MAWLNAPVADLNNRSRFSSYAPGELKTPALEWDRQVKFLNEMGSCGSNGFGLCGFSWQEILAWSTLTRADIDPWEAKLIFDASNEYAHWFKKSADLATPSPWKDAPVSRAAVEFRLHAGFRALMAATNKGRKQ